MALHIEACALSVVT